MTITFATSAAPLTTTSFAAHIDAPMPRGLREEADAMSFEAFHDEYASNSGPLRLGNWQCTDAERPSTRLGPQARNYKATLAVGDRISTSAAAASGPVGALTAFHQVPAGEHTATFVRGSNGAQSQWAMGWSDDPTQSALRAVIACANRLLTAARAPKQGASPAY